MPRNGLLFTIKRVAWHAGNWCTFRPRLKDKSVIYFGKLNFSTQAQKIKNSTPQKNIPSQKFRKIGVLLYFRKCKHQKQVIGTFLYFRKWKHQKILLYFLKRKLFLHFRKQKPKKNSLYFRRNFQSPKNQNFLYFSKRGYE